jgi:hypothetical protein
MITSQGALNGPPDLKTTFASFLNIIIKTLLQQFFQGIQKADTPKQRTCSEV